MNSSTNYVSPSILERDYSDKGVFVDLTYDSGFKAVFADRANKTILISLLNHVLPPEARVDDIVEYLDREQGRDTPDGRLTQFDLICKGADGTRFIVEFQRSREKAFFQRCIYYAAGTYHITLKKREQYDVLRPVYSIGFLNYNLEHKDKALWDRDNLVSEYIFTEKRTGEVAPPTISAIFVELARFDKTEVECKTEMDWLCYIFRHSVSLVEIPDEIRRKPFFNNLLEACRIAAFNEKKKMLYERSIMKERDIIAQREYAVEESFNEGYDKGRTEGIAEGIEKGMEKGKAEGARENAIITAKNALKNDIAPELVASITGLNINEVLSLKSNGL